jgi:hypothetical protein
MLSAPRDLDKLLTMCPEDDIFLYDVDIIMLSVKKTRNHCCCVFFWDMFCTLDTIDILVP